MDKSLLILVNWIGRLAVICSFASATLAQTGSMQRDAQRAAELQVEMLEDRIDRETQWIVARPQAETQQLLSQLNSLQQRHVNSEEAQAYYLYYYEALADKLRERANLTTQQRRGTASRNAFRAEQAPLRDRATWTTNLPRPEAIAAAYSGNGRVETIRRLAALEIIHKGLMDTTNWNITTLKGQLLNTEYNLAIARIYNALASNPPSLDEIQNLKNDQQFRQPLLQQFLPQVAAYEAAVDHRHQKNSSQESGAKTAIALSIILTIVLAIWAIFTWIKGKAKSTTFRVTEGPGKLDITYRGSVHGIRALFASLLFWYFLMGVILFMISQTDFNPEQAISRNHLNREWIASFIVWFFILGTPVAFLFIFNLLRFRKRQFSITEEALVRGLRKSPLNDVETLFVFAPAEGASATISRSPGSSVYFIGSGPAVAAAFAGATVGQAMQAGRAAASGIGQLLYAALSLVRYRVCFASSGNRETLARNLSKNRAEAMLARIGKFLNAKEAKSESSDAGDVADQAEG